MSGRRLYFYMCRACNQTCVSVSKAQWGEPQQCMPPCNSYMKFLYSFLVETDQHRQWVARGLVYNPGTGKDPQPGSMRAIPTIKAGE